MQNTAWKTPREEPERKPRSEYGVEPDRGSHPLSKEGRRDRTSDVGKNQRGNPWTAETSCPLSGSRAQDFARHESLGQDHAALSEEHARDEINQDATRKR